MAGEATHIILADRCIERHSTLFDRSQFLQGTVFPDIRYLGDLSRDETHDATVSLSDVVASSDAFVAGVRFHSVVDRVRNDFMKQSGIYDLCPPFLYDQQALKLCEDEILYDAYSDWNTVCHYFDMLEDVPRSEFRVRADAVRAWYTALRGYIEKRPTDEARRALLSLEGYSTEAIILMNAYIEELKKNTTVTAIMQKFADTFFERV